MELKNRLIYKVRLNYILFMSPTLQGYRYVKTERMEEDVHAHNKQESWTGSVNTGKLGFRARNDVPVRDIVK